MRRSIPKTCLTATIALAGWDGSVALGAGKERLLMPYECTVSRGRLAVRPSATKSYEIAGARSDQPVTACHRDSDICTTLMVHRFDVMCGAVRVPWVHVAHAASTHLAGRRWIERGRLGIIRPSRSGDVTERWLLPAGYAPLGEVGARLEKVARAAPETPPPPKPTPVAAPEAALVAKAEPPVISADKTAPLSPGVTPPEPQRAPVAPANVAGLAPGKVIEAVDLSEVAPSQPASPLSSNLAYLWLAGLMVLAATAFAVRRVNLAQLPAKFSALDAAVRPRVQSLMQRLQRLDQSPEAEAPASDPQSVQDPALANAAWQAASLLDQIEQSVDELDHTTPLRGVLQDELDNIHQRLVATRAAALDGGSPEKAASQFRALIRELERVRRIANGAATSFSNPRPAASAPQTKSEAYAVLGVNSDVSDGIIKKIVDALRMTWHPDLAKSEQDRLVREERIKQINIAWDIICDKRHAA